MRQAFPLLLVFLVLLLSGLALYRKQQLETNGISASDPKPAPTSLASSTEKTAAIEPVKAVTAPWPQTASDIPADPRTVFGTLENGFRYMIVPNAEPPGQAVIRLHVDAGSLMEEDDQQGLAHFLEHMVFNGSRNFTPDELIKEMQRQGIAFGTHLNAYTSFDETVYKFGLPDLEEDTINTTFTAMRDFADGALLLEKEIDKERGVILKERTSRDSVQNRIQKQQFADLLPESLIPRRFPIGTVEAIQSVPRQRFIDFYETFYNPQLMTFIVVGDVDPADIEPRIKSTFASMVNKRPLKTIDYGTVKTDPGLNTSIYSDKELASTSISLTRVAADTAKTDTRKTRLEDLPLNIAHAMLNRRFSKIAKLEDAAIQGGYSGVFRAFNLAEIGYVDVTAAPGRWKDAVGVLEQQVRQAALHGFTQAELDEISAEVINSYEQQVQTASTRESNSIADQLASSINDGLVFSTPQTDLEIIRTGVGSLTPASCHEAFSSYWDSSNITLSLTTKTPPSEGEEALVSLYKHSQSVAVTPPMEKVTLPWAYENFGTPGTYSSTSIDDLGITQLQFENGVRVNLKQTDFEENSISLLVRFGSGKLNMPLDKPGLDTFLQGTFTAGGLKEHSVDGLQQTLAGRNVVSNFIVNEDSFALTGNTTPQDLTLQLQLMTAYLSSPGKREEAVRQFRASLPGIYSQMLHTQQGAFTQLRAALRSDDPRFVFPEEEQLASYTFADTESWLTPALEAGYLEVSIVGDIDMEATTAALASTFGALPPREAAKPLFAAERSISYPTTPANKTYTFDSRLDKSSSIVLWKTRGLETNIAESRRLQILAEILSDRMREKLREELGATYSPSASSSQSETFPEIGFIQAYSSGTPDLTEAVSDIIRDIGISLARNGVTQDELDRSLKPFITTMDNAQRDNSYWLGKVLAKSQEHPTRLDWARSLQQDYATITIEDINTLARQYLLPQNSIIANFLPESAVAQ